MSTIHKSLNDLESAAKGLSAITEELEETFKALLKNQIPEMWKRKSYLSDKMLGSWMNDLHVRIEYIQVNDPFDTLEKHLVTHNIFHRPGQTTAFQIRYGLEVSSIRNLF